MNATLTRACTAAVRTAFLAVGGGGAGTAFAVDTPTTANPDNADQDGNPIPQAPADADVDSTVHPDGCPADPGFSFSKVKSTFVGDKTKTVHGQSGILLSVSVAQGHTWTGTVTYARESSSRPPRRPSAPRSPTPRPPPSPSVGRGKFRRTRRMDGLPLVRRVTPSTGSAVLTTVAASGSSRTTGPPSSRRSRPTSPTRELRTT